MALKHGREKMVDVLKGLCILLVCFTHYAWSDEECSAMLFPWWVDMAVPIFMVLSGYVYARSADKKGINSLSQAYDFRELLSKLLRFTVPVIPVFIATVVLDNQKHGQIPYDILDTFLQGGRGPGSYYYPVMVQTIFILPIIQTIVKRYEEKGLLLCLAANFVYEVLHVAYMMPVACYRLLMFRYIFVLAAGCYLALDKKLPIVLSLLMLCGGALFIWETQHGGYQPRFLIHWISTSFAASMLIVPVVWLIVRFCKFGFWPLELLGKASYNIFLVQMLYYYSIAAEVYQKFESRKQQLLVSMAICVCVGVLYYFLETPLTKLIQKGIRKIKKVSL